MITIEKKEIHSEVGPKNGLARDWWRSASFLKHQVGIYTLGNHCRQVLLRGILHKRCSALNRLSLSLYASQHTSGVDLLLEIAL